MAVADELRRAMPGLGPEISNGQTGRIGNLAGVANEPVLEAFSRDLRVKLQCQPGIAPGERLVLIKMS